MISSRVHINLEVLEEPKKGSNMMGNLENQTLKCPCLADSETSGTERCLLVKIFVSLEQ